MPTLIFGHSEVLARWASAHIPHVAEDAFGPCQAIGVASGNDADAKLYAVIVYHDWNQRARTVQISAAATSPRWATPGTLRALLHYPFMQMGVYKVWLAIPQGNDRALRFNLGIGMKQDAVLRHQLGPRRHAVIVSMTYDEYRKSRWFVKGLEKAA